MKITGHKGKQVFFKKKSSRFQSRHEIFNILLFSNMNIYVCTYFFHSSNLINIPFTRYWTSAISSYSSFFIFALSCFLFFQFYFSIIYYLLQEYKIYIFKNNREEVKNVLRHECRFSIKKKYYSRCANASVWIYDRSMLSQYFRALTAAFSLSLKLDRHE